MLKKRFMLFLLLTLLGSYAKDASAYFGHCAFQNVARGKFCRSASNDHMITTRTGIGSSEIYNIIDAGAGQVTIKEVSTGLFLQVPAGSDSIVASATDAASNQTKFVQTDLGSGRFAFKSVANGQYARVANDGANYAWYANGGATVDSTYEQFQIAPCQIDVWSALTAFATGYPNKMKLKSSNSPPAPGSDMRLTAEMVSGSYHYWYQIFQDYRFNPIGHPVYDKNSLAYIGDWECWVVYGTLPQYQNGLQWTQGIPRTRRYCDAGVQEDSPSQSVTWYDINMSNQLVNGRNAAGEWGRRYVGWMQDLSTGRGNSQVDMGSRWVMRVGYKSGTEGWILDLGPAIGVFAPKYGTVGYASSFDGAIQWFNNVQDAYDIVPKRWSAF